MTDAILKITDGTDAGEVSLIGGPFYLKDWAPAIAEYKEGGVYVDSPLSDGRRIVFKRFGNALERFVVVHGADDPDSAARDMQKLHGLLEKASDYWISNSRKGVPIYLEVRAHGETNIRYANIISGRVPALDNLFSQPFLQPDCSTVQDNLDIIIERDHWRGAPPGGAVAIHLSGASAKDNYLISGDFDDGPQSTKSWTTTNSPTVAYTRSIVYEGPYSAKITGSSGAERGIYQDVGSDFLTSGASYTVTAWVYIETGGAILKAWDGGTFNNAVSDSYAGTGWYQLSVTKAATASGIRVGLLTDSSFYTIAYFSSAFLGRTFGQTDTRYSDPILVSNYKAQTHLTHIFTRDVVGAGYSSNLLDSSLPYALLPSGAAQDDEVYFGSYVKSDIGGPFSSIVFNLGRGADQVNTELISNQSFETSLSGWSIGYAYGPGGMTIERTSAYGAYSGSYSVRMAYNRTAVPQISTSTGYIDLLYFYEPGNSISGTQVRFGGWFKWDRTLTRSLLQPPASTNDETFASFAVLQVRWKNGSGQVVRTYEKTVDVGYVITSGIITSFWTYNEILANKPPGAVTADFRVTVRVSPELSAAAVQGPGFLFDLTSGREPVSGYNMVWEYWDGSAWSALSTRDNTDILRNPGLNALSWQIPDDWERTTVNSVNAYWVRGRITSLSGTFIEPEQHVEHPFVVANPYVDLPAAGITGDLSALGRLHIRNEGGPFDDAQSIRITAGGNDVLADHGGSTLTTGGATAQLQDNRSLGLRFESVQIPQGAKIHSARLFCTPSGYDSVPIVNFLTSVYCEDYDNATSWTNYTDYNGRALTTARQSNDFFYPDWALRTLNNDVYIIDNIEGPIQEVVDRAGWTPGSALHLRLKEYDIGGYNGWPATGYRTVDMYETSSDAWELEIEFVQNETYTTTIVAGTRNLSRGELFNAYINMRPKSQGGIEVRGARMVADQDVALANRSALIFQADDPAAPSFTRRGTVLIPNPLAEQYTGTFRVFLRVSHDSNLSGTYETSFRLLFKAGPATTRTKTAQSGSSTPQFVDMGQVTIPELTALDSIIIEIEAARPDTDVGATVDVYIHDLVLMPSDEWTGEFTSRSPSVTGQLNADLIMEIDSIDPRRGHIDAALLDENTNLKKGALAHSANRLSFDPKETSDYRLWLLAITDTYLDYAEEMFLSDPTLERTGGLPGAVHSVQFYTLPTYLSLRGNQ